MAPRTTPHYATCPPYQVPDQGARDNRRHKEHALARHRLHDVRFRPDTSAEWERPDHGWGNHHLVLGGGRIYGRFPLMTNYANFNALADDYADTRGTMLPSTSLAPYNATLAR